MNEQFDVVVVGGGGAGLAAAIEARAAGKRWRAGRFAALESEKEKR